MLEKRAGMPEDYCRMADKRIGERVLAMEIYKQAQVIFTYVGTAKETDTRGIILAALAEGKLVYDPNTMCAHHHEGESHSCRSESHGCGGSCGK